MAKKKNKKEITALQAKRALWRRGELKYKLHDVQRVIYDRIRSRTDEITTLLCSRRIGKSFLLCTLSIEECIRQKNVIIKYICPKQKMVKTIIKPIVQTIIEDAPPELKPEFKTQENKYVFPNGSEIQLAGTDNGNHESIRGGYSHIYIVDEAGFCDELGYVVNSVLAPTTDTTDGFGILASTPSKSSDHEFITHFVNPALYHQKLMKYTIDDNPMMTPEKIAQIEARYEGGRANYEFRREYLCEIIDQNEDSVIPEFTDEVQKKVVREWEKPPYFDGYVSLDIGVRDLTVALFGYYDFLNNKIVIQDEYVINGPEMTTDKVAKAIFEKERALWGNPNNPHETHYKPPYLRVSDNNNLLLLNDLDTLHNLRFIPTRKDNKEAAINQVKMKLSDAGIIIDPKCKVLIYHIKNAKWDKARKSFTRSPDAGHYDALDALIYFVRNVVPGKNPFPRGYGAVNPNSHYVKAQTTNKYDDLVNAFMPSKKKRN